MKRGKIPVRFCAEQSLQDRVVIDTTFHPRLTKKDSTRNSERERERERIEGTLNEGGRKGYIREDLQCDTEGCSNIPSMYSIPKLVAQM